MKTSRKRAATRKLKVEPISVWQALNEPIVEVSQESAKVFFTLLAVAIMAIWLAPYWGNHNPNTTNLGRVAGAQVTLTLSPPISRSETGGDEEGVIPAWYDIAQAVPGDVATAFSSAGSQVLDISQPVSQVVGFYKPGVQAVSDAWLQLIADPY